MDIKTKQMRHTCLCCKRKKIASKMFKHGSHWTCVACFAKQSYSGDQAGTCLNLLPVRSGTIKVLNLYCGIGGNRKFWKGVKVTAVEKNTKVAVAYKTLYLEDEVIIGDAHTYLLKHYKEFDVIWSSPPCTSHSRMNYCAPFHKKVYPDLSLYQEIILLKNFFKGVFVIENVIPYYDALVPVDARIGRHCFWTNAQLNENVFVPKIECFIELCNREDKKRLQDWLGIYYEKDIYLSGKNYCQVFRNCVHPNIGKSIFEDVLRQIDYNSRVIALRVYTQS